MSWIDRFAEIRSRDWSTVPEPEREAMAREVVQMTAYASAAAAVVPIPFTDLALLLPFHSVMVMTVGHCLGRKLNDAEAKRVAVELGAIAGATIAGRAAISLLKKLVFPGFGGLLAAPASFAVTWAFGRLTIAYFKDPDQSRESLNAVFKDAMKEGSKHFSKEAFDRFRKSQSAESEATPSEPTPEPESPKTAEPPSRRENAPVADAAEDERPPPANLKTKKRSL